MEYLPNGFTLQLCEGAFPLSTDSMLLADFVKLRRNARVLDLGSGCATLGVALCAKDETCCVTGLEITESAHLAALDNIRRNDLTSRLTSICRDLRELPEDLTGKFHCCVSNPPYFSGGPLSQRTPLARHENCCTPEELFAAASKAVRYGGDVYLVHKPERLAELCACAVNHKLQPKRLQLLRHKPADPISLVLLQCRKGGKPGLTIEEAYLQETDGNHSDYYRKLYHI